MPSESHCVRCGAGYEQGYCPNGCRSEYAIGDRIIVTDESPIELGDGQGRWTLYRGARGTVVGHANVDCPWIDFDGVPHMHAVAEHRFRPLDVIEMLAEVERGREPS